MKTTWLSVIPSHYHRRMFRQRNRNLHTPVNKIYDIFIITWTPVTPVNQTPIMTQTPVIPANQHRWFPNMTQTTFTPLNQTLTSIMTQTQVTPVNRTFPIMTWTQPQLWNKHTSFSTMTWTPVTAVNQMYLICYQDWTQSHLSIKHTISYHDRQMEGQIAPASEQTALLKHPQQLSHSPPNPGVPLLRSHREPLALSPTPAVW